MSIATWPNSPFGGTVMVARPVVTLIGPSRCSAASPYEEWQHAAARKLECRVGVVVVAVSRALGLEYATWLAHWMRQTDVYSIWLPDTYPPAAEWPLMELGLVLGGTTPCVIGAESSFRAQLLAVMMTAGGRLEGAPLLRNLDAVIARTEAVAANCRTGKA